MIYPSFIYLLLMPYIRYYDINSQFFRSLFTKIKQTRDFFRRERYLIRHVLVTLSVYSVYTYIWMKISHTINKFPNNLETLFFLYKVTIWLESSFICLGIWSVINSSFIDIIYCVSNNEMAESKSFAVCVW